jgi:hypothetical protein
MKILTATSATQGAADDDYCFTIENELVMFPPIECDCPDCGCRRGVAGLESRRATTTFAVTERRDLDPASYRTTVRHALVAQGYLGAVGVGDDAWVDDGWVDDGWVDEMVAQLRFVAELFPVGTVLGRTDTGVQLRRIGAAG